MLLAIDIGNSAIKAGFFEEQQLTYSFSMGTDYHKTADEYAFFLKNLSEKDLRQVTAVMLGSVAPSVTEKIKKALSKLTCAPVFTVGPGMRTGFPLRIDNPRELGADLAANAAGAIERYGFPVIVADFGSVTTVLAVDSEGAYRGGCFMPGIDMSLEGLTSAELLPEIPAEQPPAALATNTADCMRSGVIRGQAFAVMGFVKSYKTRLELPKDTPLVVTGGHAALISPCLPPDTHVEELLTLKGLNAIYRFNRKDRKNQ